MRPRCGGGVRAQRPRSPPQTRAPSPCPRSPSCEARSYLRLTDFFASLNSRLESNKEEESPSCAPPPSTNVRSTHLPILHHAPAQWTLTPPPPTRQPVPPCSRPHHHHRAPSPPAPLVPRQAIPAPSRALCQRVSSRRDARAGRNYRRGPPAAGWPAASPARQQGYPSHASRLVLRRAPRGAAGTTHCVQHPARLLTPRRSQHAPRYAPAGAPAILSACAATPRPPRSLLPPLPPPLGGAWRARPTPTGHCAPARRFGSPPPVARTRGRLPRNPRKSSVVRGGSWERRSPRALRRGTAG